MEIVKAEKALPIHRRIRPDEDGPGYFVEGVEGGPFSKAHAERLQYMRTDGTDINELDVKDEAPAAEPEANEPTDREQSWMTGMETELNELHDKVGALTEEVIELKAEVAKLAAPVTNTTTIGSVAGAVTP